MRNVARLGADRFPVASMARATARYRPACRSRRPTFRENAVLLRPAVPVRLIAATVRYRVRAPVPLTRWIVILTRAVSLSVKRKRVRFANDLLVLAKRDRTGALVSAP